MEKVTIGPDNITGNFKGKDNKPGEQFVTVRVDDPGLVKETGRSQGRLLGTLREQTSGGCYPLGWDLPIAVMILIWRYAMKKMGPGMGVMSFAKSKAKLFAQNETKVNFSDVAGIDEAKQELQEVVEFLQSPEKFQRLGGRIP